MRVGANPQKMKSFVMTEFYHQVVIPVYIPYQRDYFQDSFKVLKFCLESLFKTTHNKTFITVINNGSDGEVTAYLNRLLKEKKIHEVIHTVNIGKINALIKGIKGHLFDLITIADSDVLFLNNWQKETVEVFNNFPKAGVVGIVPQYKLHESLSYNLIFDKFWSSELKFRPVKNKEALKRFYQSIGWNPFKDIQINQHLTIKNNDGFEAVVGSAHFVATYKPESFKHTPNVTSPIKMHDVERIYFDFPVLKVDGWRLTTTDNYAYHMGNVCEEWMNKDLSKLKNDNYNVVLDKTVPLESSRLKFFIKNKVFRRILDFRLIKQQFLLRKGLKKNALKYHL